MASGLPSGLYSRTCASQPDQVGGALAGGKGAGTNAILLQQPIGMRSKPAGLDDLLAAFQKNGLGSIVQSWVGTGQNLPISPAQIQQALGSGMLGELTAKAGVQALPEPALAEL